MSYRFFKEILKTGKELKDTKKNVLKKFNLTSYTDGLISFVSKTVDAFNGVSEDLHDTYQYTGPMFRYISNTKPDEIYKAIYETGILKQNHPPEYDKNGKEIIYSAPLEKYVIGNDKNSNFFSGCGKIEDVTLFATGPKESHPIMANTGKSKKEQLIQEAILDYDKSLKEGGNPKFSSIIETKKLNLKTPLFLKPGTILCLKTNKGTSAKRWNANLALQALYSIDNPHAEEKEVIGVGDQTNYFSFAISTDDIPKVVLNRPVTCIVSGKTIMDVNKYLTQENTPINQEVVESEPLCNRSSLS